MRFYHAILICRTTRVGTYKLHCNNSHKRHFKMFCVQFKNYVSTYINNVITTVLYNRLYSPEKNIRFNELLRLIFTLFISLFRALNDATRFIRILFL